MIRLLSMIFIVGVAAFAATGCPAHPPPSLNAEESSRDRWHDQVRIAIAEKDFRARYRDIDLPILTQARNDPEALWRFLTDPLTPYLQRQAAAHRCAEVFPPEYVPRLRRSIDALRRHSWRVRPHPSCSLLRPPDWTSEETEGPLDVLGHAWMPPDEPIEHPLTWEEHLAAPWPWQVEQALWKTWSSLSNGMPQDNRRRLTEIALALPRATDEEANLFLDVSRVAHITDELLAAQYAIAFDPELRTAAQQVTQVHLRLVRRADVKDAPALATAFVEDVLRHSPHERARDNAALYLKALSPAAHLSIQRPLRFAPCAAVIAACERAIDEETGSEHWAAHIARGHDVRHVLQWHRLYVYAFSVCKAIPDPPLRVRRIDSRSPEVATMLKEFADWFKANREELEAHAARQQERIDAARARLATLGTSG